MAERNFPTLARVFVDLGSGKLASGLDS